jgi:hypothetical protein
VSFDLFVYFTPPAGLKERWEGALADEGLPLRFPEGVDLLEFQEDLQVTWVGKPRLIELPAGETSSYFTYFEVGPRGRDADGDEDDAEDIPELLRASVDGATHEAFFTSSAGRSADGLALQLFGAAALAKASGGVVLDPQGGGYMSADEALMFAHETLSQFREATKAEEADRAERAEGLEELERRWLWFRGSFFASCAVWAFLVAFLFVIDLLKVSASAAWVPVVTLVPWLAAVVLATRSTRNYLDVIGVTWPLPWMLGGLSFFPPIHAVVFWWGRKRYRLLKARLQPR